MLHCAHVDGGAPAGDEYFPGSQDMQVVFDVAPSDDECVPPGQTEHVLVPSVDEYVPAAQASHTDIPVAPLNLPTAHLTQSLCSCAPILAECVPAGQLMQELTFDTLVDG